VVHDADAVSDATMGAFARETKLSETSFVQSPTHHGADYRHRIFMPPGEIPFAGHPSLGTAVAVARERGLESARLVQQTRPGLQPVDVEIAGERARASMLQEPGEWGAELEPGEVLPLVGLDPALGDPALPAQVVSTGAAQVLVAVRDAAALEHAVPDYDAIGALLDIHGAIVLYLAAVDPGAGTARARAFTGSAQVGEDPATGSAAGPLCVHAAAKLGVERLAVTQGVEMGRPSLLRTALEGDRVRVEGDVVVLVDGRLHLDV